MQRTGRVITGFALVAAGVAMLALPGPGLVTIAAGLALLARDLRWADRLRQRLGAAESYRRTSPQDQEGG
ncbi:MAG: PGPGW domain-containing protein [Acidimicrobiia bacterium]